MKAAGTLLLAFFAAMALAQTPYTAISNLGQSTSTDLSVGYVPGYISLNSCLAVSFTTGNSACYFTNASVLMANSAGGGTFSLSVYSNNGGVPGSILACLSGNPNPTSAGVYVYTNASSLEFSANTTYWLVATNSGGSGLYYWCTTQSTSLAPASIWALGALEDNDLQFTNNVLASNPGWQNYFLSVYPQFSMTVIIPQLPSLSISQAIVLTYQATGFPIALQQNSNLATTNWVNVTNAVLNGVISNQTVFILPSSSQMFYRLTPAQ